MTTAEIFALLQKIPATFWGVVFGSFFSILAVWLTNRASTTRLLHQFQHERLVKASERELTLRKEIYLDAAEAVSVALSSIVNFANLEIPNEKVMERYTEKSVALAKVQVVASMETVNAFLALTGELNSQLMKLWSIRHQLMAERRLLLNIDAQGSQFQKEADRFLEMIKQYNINGVSDAARWRVLENNFEFEQKRSVESLQKRKEVAHQLGVKHLAFIKQCSMATMSITPLVIPVLMEVRKELQLPMEVEVYRASIERNLARQRETMEAYMDELSTTISPRKPGETTIA